MKKVNHSGYTIMIKCKSLTATTSPGVGGMCNIDAAIVFGGADNKFLKVTTRSFLIIKKKLV